MILTIGSIAAYLGRPASMMLSALPFKEWSFERSVETDLGEPTIDYVFPDNGIDFSCDQHDHIATIFIDHGPDRYFSADLSDLPLSSNCQDVFTRLGRPSESGNGFVDPVLGACGAWDRFARLGYALHVQYWPNVDRISKVTLMRDDVIAQLGIQKVP